MRQQTEAAIAQADLVLFLIDARDGVVAADEMFAELARNSGKPVILAANKCEGRAAEPGDLRGLRARSRRAAADLGRAWHRHRRAQRRDSNRHAANAAEQRRRRTKSDAAEEGPHPLRIAIVGRPNVGKSTLINALLGEERMITGPEAGITRDAIASSSNGTADPCCCSTPQG